MNGMIKRQEKILMTRSIFVIVCNCILVLWLLSGPAVPQVLAVYFKNFIPLYLIHQ
jgi:hypothetical protein